MSQAALEAAWDTLLTTNQGAGTFYAAVGGRIHNGEAPADSPMPHAVWLVVSDVPDSVFGERDDLEAEIQVELWGEKRLGKYVLSQANDLLFNLAQYADLTITGFTGGHARCIDRGAAEVMEEAYRILSRWQVRATKS